MFFTRYHTIFIQWLTFGWGVANHAFVLAGVFKLTQTDLSEKTVSRQRHFEYFAQSIIIFKYNNYF